uniref:Uncharacterized protein n=1 Tax=Arundo donax TaxID=35708 RepID=A0A0A9AQ07_ARUDO
MARWNRIYENGTSNLYS